MANKDNFEELSPNFKKVLISKGKSLHPFWSLLGIELVDIKKGWAVVKLNFDQKLMNLIGDI